MKTTIIKEITELHDFFTAWFNGKLENTDQNFSRFQDVISPAFRMIDPHGKKHHQAALLIQIKNAHGSRPGLKISIENVTLRLYDQGYILATYEEWQEIDAAKSSRLSSVLFKEDENTPNGLQWIHLHETWIGN